MHDSPTIIDDDTEKPEIILDYNIMKGIHMVGQLLNEFHIARVKRWPKAVLYSLMNTAGISAQILYCSNPENYSEGNLKKFIFFYVSHVKYVLNKAQVAVGW
jgi:hypothetical protein